MQLPSGTVLHVKLCWAPGAEVAVGRLGMRDRLCLFEFDPTFLADGLEISPLRLRGRPGVIETREPLFENLPGVFNDSLPDGWGRLLLDRQSRRHGVPPERLTPLDRLAHVGVHGIGALVYRPEFPPEARGTWLDLDDVAAETRSVLEGTGDDVLGRLQALGGSPQGARPKALVQIEDATGRVTDGLADRGEGWRHWLVKFASPADVADIGPVEFAYARTAAAAGIEVPQVRLLPSTSGPGYFAAARFDRDGPRRRHVATAAGLLHADFRAPSLDYTDLAKLAVRLCRDHRQGEALFRLAAFNVLAHNRDDHAKQFSFVMERDGAWRLAPAYDLTFSMGPGGEHTTAVAGEGRQPKREHLLRVADAAGLTRGRAGEVLGQVHEAVMGWSEVAVAAGVSDASRRRIGRVLAETGRLGG
jgi:serine/threonine-protein kinase HipA